MILATDTHYTDAVARTAGVAFQGWVDEDATWVQVVESSAFADYEPGSFYKRELPLILDLLRRVETRPSTIVIDGYVYLDASSRKGLGAHLFEALGCRVPVVGVAKNAFRGSGHAVEVLRGRSRRPLYVTAAGMNAEVAAQRIRSMSGAHRLPALLTLVDRLSRGTLS